MTCLRSPVALVLLAALAACQAPPTPPVVAPSMSPGPGEVVASSPSPSLAPSAEPSQRPVTGRVFVTGGVFDDMGATLDGASVEVTSETHPEVNQKVEAFGGSYAIGNVPADAVLKLRVTRPGYTAREQLVKATAVPYGADSNPNIHDFGGQGNGMLYALSKFPEISMTEPANQSVSPVTSSLRVVFKLSHPFSAQDRARMESLLRISLPGPEGQPIEIKAGSGYHDTAARLSWDESGTTGTFTFDAPIVTYYATNALATVYFDQNAPLEDWPRDANGRMLGQIRAAKTAEGSGAEVRNQVAPFLRTRMPERPSERPAPEELWGLTHSSTISFNLKADGVRPKVTSVRGIRGQNGSPDRILVTFSKPMRGYPEGTSGNHHDSVLKASHYRYLLGTAETRQERERFENGNPQVLGSTPDTLEFASSSDTIIALNLGAGALDEATDIKVLVDEKVTDIAGNPLQTSTPDPVTHLADHVLRGVVQ